VLPGVGVVRREAGRSGNDENAALHREGRCEWYYAAISITNSVWTGIVSYLNRNTIGTLLAPEFFSKPRMVVLVILDMN
jgi:hypothetical protein